MKRFPVWPQAVRGWLRNPAVGAWLATLVAAVVLIPGWRVLDARYEHEQRAAFRLQVREYASGFASRLSAAVHRRLMLVDGLYAFVQSQLPSPDFASDLKSFSAGLHAAAPGIRAVEVVPGTVIRFVYPLEGNERALYHDLSADPRPEVREDLERARAMRGHCLTGPLELWQGGLGLIARRVVERDGKFWGYVTLVLDVKPIVQEVDAETKDTIFALRDRQGRVFQGDEAVFRKGAVVERVLLPDGYWEVGAAPAAGWDSMPRRAVLVNRYLTLSLALAMCALAFLFTERQLRLARAVRAGEEEYRLVTDSAPALIAAFDEQHGCRFANVTHESWFGQGRAGLLGRRLDEIWGASVSETIAARSGDLASGQKITLDAALPAPDGSTRYATLTVVPRKEDGRATGLYLVATDITERRAAEEEQKKLASLVEMGRDFVGIAHEEGAVHYLNPAAMRMIGIEDQEHVRRMHVTGIFAGSHREQALREILPAARTEGAWVGESRFRHQQTGDAVDVELTAFQIGGSGGTRPLLALVARDVTERNKAEALRARLEAQLAQSQKMESVGRLAGGVAHDFNNLLTVITGYAALVLDGGLPAGEAHRYLKEVKKAGDRAAELTRQLLAFSRRQVIELKPLNPGSVVAGMASMLGRLLGDDVQLVTTTDDSGWMVMADKGQLEQVIMNLAVNARDAMPQGGRLTLETVNVRLDEDGAAQHNEARPGEYVCIACRDTGHGMDGATRARIFEPFFTTKKEGEGTGLGLAMVFGIVKQCGGWIEVESEPGRGSTFRIYLPRTREAPALPPAGRRHEGGSSGETIAVVEDSPEIREYIVAVLESQGYVTLPAGSAEEALERIRAHAGPLDLLLTDVVLPSMTGRQLAERAESLRPGLRVLYMSGYSADVISHDGILDAGLEFIPKPFSPGELSGKVRAILGTPSVPSGPQ